VRHRPPGTLKIQCVGRWRHIRTRVILLVPQASGGLRIQILRGQNGTCLFSGYHLNCGSQWIREEQYCRCNQVGPRRTKRKERIGSPFPYPGDALLTILKLPYRMSQRNMALLENQSTVRKPSNRPKRPSDHPDWLTT
jgi:hypothetical protein